MILWKINSWSEMSSNIKIQRTDLTIDQTQLKIILANGKIRGQTKNVQTIKGKEKIVTIEKLKIKNIFIT